MHLQLFLIWNNAIKHYNYIIKTLSSTLKTKKVYEAYWDQTKTANQIIKLYQCTSKQAQTKLLECGYGKIFIILVEDITPLSKLYPTKYGIIEVSKHAQEIKSEIRMHLNGNKSIHGTMTDFEFINDINVCLNYTEQDIQNLYKTDWNKKICKI